MSKSSTWYCRRGCNVFSSTHYANEDPPECGACGSRMSTESEQYDDAHEQIEANQIAKFKDELSR